MTTKIIVFLEGGLIEEVMTDQDAEVMIVDYDLDGLGEDEIKMVDGKEAYIHRFSPYIRVDAGKINEIFAKHYK